MQNDGAAGSMSAKTLLLAVLLTLGAVVVAAPTASAVCYDDPDDPVGSVECGLHSTVRCVKAIVQHDPCPV